MLKAQRKSTDEPEKSGLSAIINPGEAKDHVKDLEALMLNINERVKTGDMGDLLNETLKNMKTRLAATIPSMETANVNIVLEAIKDKDFHALFPRTESGEKLLEELLPGDEIPRASGVVRAV